jgi:hypothetical protein
MRVQERSEKEALAKMLQVKIEDYPYPAVFPLGYYASILEIGMSINEVHKNMKGYKRVFQCKNNEVYYFYTEDDDTATRIRIIYDSNFNLKKLDGEEPDSRTIQIFGCTEGLLEPK